MDLYYRTLAIGLLCGAIIVLGGTWLRVLGTAGLLTLFVDLQFDWFDTSPHLWIPAFAIGTLLLCWLARAHLSRIIAPVFAIMLASTVALYALRRRRAGGSRQQPSQRRVCHGEWPSDDRAHHFG